MKVALIGLPQSGKTTMFRALTGAGGHREKGALNLGVVKVPDARVDRLSDIFQPKKKIYAVIEVVEANAPHASEKKAGQSALDAAFLNLVKPMDAFLLVARAFDEAGLNEPGADVETILGEFLLADLMVLESRLERDSLDHKKGKPGMPADERAALEKCQALLNEGKRVVDDPALSAEPLLRSYAFLTSKPVIVVANVAEADAAADRIAVLSRFGLPVAGQPTFACCAQVEAEIQELPEEERPEFMEAMGITEPAMNVVIREIYQALGLMSFLTSGEDECRAWTIRKGTPAPQAAGTVHSDIEKGFIRAEVIGYDEFIALGSEAAAKKAGKYRLEGRDYVVQDGDIIHFRFNI
jgi:GTP-binding protein YchF